MFVCPVCKKLFRKATKLKSHIHLEHLGSLCSFLKPEKPFYIKLGAQNSFSATKPCRNSIPTPNALCNIIQNFGVKSIIKAKFCDFDRGNGLSVVENL